MGNPGEITSLDHWDDRWKQTSSLKIREDDQYWGRNGIFLRVMRRHAKPFHAMSVLELGGANSKFLVALAKWYDAKVTAIDYSPAGIEKTRSLFSANNCSGEAILGNIFMLEPDGKTYDMVVHWGLLEHFADPASVLKVCAEKLTPGGCVVFTMPNMEAWGAVLWKRWCPANWATHLYHSDTAVQAACEAAGLELTKIFYWGAPMLQKSPWERQGFLPKAVTAAQHFVNLINRLVPLYHHGTRRSSKQRGFVAYYPGPSNSGTELNQE